jgi:lysophospholipase L1-like esterase
MIKPNSKLLFIGDSVTDCGRAQPIGEGLSNLGFGYVRDIAALLGSAAPEHRIRVVNTGLSGNTVRDLKARWDRDVIALKPNWLSIMIGINDVWRQFDTPEMDEYAVYLNEYRQTLQDLVDSVRADLDGLVLMTPYHIEPNTADAMRARMDEFGRAVRGIAEQSGAILVDTQAAFDEALRHQYSAHLSLDRVHPNPIGAMILARAFLNAVGFEW